MKTKVVLHSVCNGLGCVRHVASFFKGGGATKNNGKNYFFSKSNFDYISLVNSEQKLY